MFSDVFSDSMIMMERIQDGVVSTPIIITLDIRSLQLLAAQQ